MDVISKIIVGIIYFLFVLIILGLSLLVGTFLLVFFLAVIGSILLSPLILVLTAILGVLWQQILALAAVALIVAGVILLVKKSNARKTKASIDKNVDS